MNRLEVVPLIVTTVLACSDGETTTDDSVELQRALENTVDQVVVPAVEDFALATAAMMEQVETFCALPSESTLESLQNEWRFLASEWNRTALYNLGPLNQDLIFPRVIFIESMRQRGIDYTETVRSAIDEGVTSTAELDSAYFESLPFTEVGLLALEILVFEARADGSTALADIVAEYDATPRQCEYLRGMAAQLDRAAEGVVVGWNVEYLDSNTPFRDLLVAGELPDGAEPVPALIIAALEHLQYVNQRKLDGQLDAQLAGSFYENLIATLDELQHFLDNADYDWFDHMEARGFGAEVAEIRAAIVAARAIALTESRAELRTAWGPLEGYLKREIPNGLNVSLGLNFADGD